MSGLKRRPCPEWHWHPLAPAVTDTPGRAHWPVNRGDAVCGTPTCDESAGQEHLDAEAFLSDLRAAAFGAPTEGAAVSDSICRELTALRAVVARVRALCDEVADQHPSNVLLAAVRAALDEPTP